MSSTRAHWVSTKVLKVFLEEIKRFSGANFCLTFAFMFDPFMADFTMGDLLQTHCVIIIGMMSSQKLETLFLLYNYKFAGFGGIFSSLYNPIVGYFQATEALLSLDRFAVELYSY